MAQLEVEELTAFSGRPERGAATVVGEISLTTSLRSSIPNPEEAISVLRYTFSASGLLTGSSGLGFLCPPCSLAPGVKGAKLMDGFGESSPKCIAISLK